MNRSILNFEATVHTNGRATSGEDVYVVQLWVNHHVVRSWYLDTASGYVLTQDRASLDRFVAAKMFEMLNPVRVTVVDLNP